MPTLNEYFRTEAHDFLTALERSLQRSPAPDATELHRSVRGLRGTAQMAREQRVFDVISAFEAVTRSLAAGATSWSDPMAARARDTIADLRALLDATEDDEQLDARVHVAAARWSAPPSPGVPAPADPAADNGTREFREFTAREAAGIADALDHGIRDLQADPMDREPLRVILRRQRALLGAARLEEIPVVADILRAVEDLTRVIAKLDVGVKKEWLDIYRVARDALQTTIAPLLHDKEPQSSHAVSRLRHMRAELLERYGPPEEEAPPTEQAFAHAVTAADPMSAMEAAAAPSPSDDTTDTAAAAEPITAAQPADDAVLELDAESMVEPEEDVLELGAESMVEPEEDVLELGADSMVEPEDDVLELDADSMVEQEDDVLELDADSMVEPMDDLLELDADSIVAPAGDMLELDTPVEPAEDALDVAPLSYTREDALRRALALRDVVARAAGHDPQARAAVEELFDLIRVALG